MNAGRLIAEGNPKELKTNYLKNPIYEIECDRVVDAMELLEKQDFVNDTSIFGNQIHVIVDEKAGNKELIEKTLNQHTINIIRIDKIIPTLEDVFIHLLEEDNK
jgi:ABC-2 type transport system ATP-binding protein